MRSPEFAVPNLWKFSDRCRDCDAAFDKNETVFTAADQCRACDLELGVGGAAPVTPSTSINWVKGFSGKADDQTMDVKSGEVLKFVWTGGHNVYQMKDKAAFDACDFTAATNLGATSPVYHTMGAATTYFACKVGAHCNSGQKLSAVVPAPGVKGCDGVVNSGKVNDCAGACGGTAVLSGCDNKCGSTKAEDVCKVCGGDGKSCLGCDGVANSGKANDSCGVCDGDGMGCKGCDGVENSGKVNDCAGACGGTAVLSGCDNTCGSTKKKDVCSVCGGDGFSCKGGSSGVDSNNKDGAAGSGGIGAAVNNTSTGMFDPSKKRACT